MIQQLQAEIQRLKSKVEVLLQQQAVAQEEAKDKEIEIQELRTEVKRLKLQNLDTTNYEEWGHEEVHQWMMGLDGGRLMKYGNALRDSLKAERVTGKDIAEIERTDLKER